MGNTTNMSDTCRTTVERLLHNSKRKAIRRISQKELKASLLVIALFKAFHIKSRINPTAQDGHNKSRIQEIINDNTIAPGGYFHFTDFSDAGFIRDLMKEFELVPKQG